MKLKMAYLKARHWEFEDEGIGYEEGMVISTGEVLGSTLGAANNVKIGLDDGTEMGSLDGSV